MDPGVSSEIKKVERVLQANGTDSSYVTIKSDSFFQLNVIYSFWDRTPVERNQVL